MNISELTPKEIALLTQEEREQLIKIEAANLVAGYDCEYQIVGERIILHSSKREGDQPLRKSTVSPQKEIPKINYVHTNDFTAISNERGDIWIKLYK